VKWTLSAVRDLTGLGDYAVDEMLLWFPNSMSVTEADFLATMQRILQRQRKPVTVQTSALLRTLFGLFDADQNGVLNALELKTGLSVLCHPDPYGNSVRASFNLMDSNGDGHISLPEMTLYLRCVFRVLHGVTNAHVPVAPDVLAALTAQNMFDEADLNHDGKISFDEFYAWYVGDYLGKEVQYQNGFCLKVLHEFVDMMDYTGLQVDEAIRHFLAGFRLPGESQKIDRMMEKFAERYCFQNPGIFPSADTAFILSFSVIMLQTDLHNPSIPEEKRMSKEGFVRNNRGINNGEDLAPEFLGGIYDRIKSTPISLKEDVDLKKRIQVQTGSVQNNDRMRREAYSKEREAMVKSSEALFKRRVPATPQSSGGGAFQLITDDTESSYVRPMFEIVWAPLLACCSRDVLQCLSHLARLQSIAQGALSTDQPFVTKQTSTPTTSKRLARGSSSPMSLSFPSSSTSNGINGGTSGDGDRSLEEDNAHRVADEVDPLQVDRVFSSSVHLTNGAIQDLVLQLCVVSLTECAGISGRGVTVRETSNAPRVFSLQKLVEVADMNMHVRSRVVWASVWKVSPTVFIFRFQFEVTDIE
ncbi:hypothetical protein DYB38_008154, partial [Aphanomyces astaci]